MKIWYSYKGKKYVGDAPPFYDLKGVGWYDKLSSDLPTIRMHLLKFLRRDNVNVQEYFNTSMVEGTRWEAVSFMFWKMKNNRTIEIGKDVFCHFTDIPGIVSVSASILQPNTRIKGHYGDTDAIYRIHLPIFVPAGLPECGITVGGITRPWIENEMIAFCDAHFHEAWNMTDKPRIVMIVDIVKEEYLSDTDKICANVLSSLKYQQFSMRYKFIKKMPGRVKDMIRNVLKLFPFKNIE